MSEAARDERVAAVVSHAGGLSQYFPKDVRRMPPVLIVQARNDPITPAAEARKLQRFLKGVRAPSELRIHASHDHILDGAEWKAFVDEALRFLDVRLQKP